MSPWREPNLSLVCPRQKSLCYWSHFLAPERDGGGPTHLPLWQSTEDVSHVLSGYNLNKLVTDSQANLAFLIVPAETGGICIAPRPSEEGAEILPAMAMRPFFGIIPALMDEKVCEGTAEALLCTCTWLHSPSIFMLSLSTPSLCAPRVRFAEDRPVPPTPPGLIAVPC